MKSKTSFFNGAIFKKNLSRFWVIWGSYLAILLLVIPNIVRSNSSHLGEQFLATATGFGTVMTFIYALLTALALFSYLFKAKSASMLHALPVRRSTLFFTNIISGLCFLVVPNIITLGVSALIAGSKIAFVTYMQWLAANIIVSVFFFAFATLCAFITGHVVAMPMLYIILNFCFVVLEFICRAGASLYIYGISIMDAPKSISFTPVVKLMMELQNNGTVFTNGWGYLTVLLVIAVVFLVISYALYSRRQLESAEDMISPAFLKPVFKYAMGIGCGLVIGAIIFACVFFNLNNTSVIKVVVVICGIVGAFIGYFGADMLLKKSFHVFKKNYKGFIAIAILFIATALALNFDVFGFEKKLPTDYDTVEITISGVGKYEIENGDEMAKKIEDIHKAIVEQKDEYGSNDVISNSNNYYYYSVEINYAGDDSLDRTYTVAFDEQSSYPEGSVPQLLYDFVNDKSSIEYRYTKFLGNDADKTIDISVYDYNGESDTFIIEKQYYNQFFAAVKADIDEGNFGRNEFIINSTVEPYHTTDSGEIEYIGYNIELQYKTPTGSANYDQISIDARCKNICSFLNLIGYNIQTNSVTAE